MRKITDGEIKNKERTKEKLINAVGEIIIKEGYSKLGVNNIARKAVVDKKLIYRYFGSVDELIACYFRKRDFWTKFNDRVFEDINMSFQDFGKQVSIQFLTNLLDSLKDVEETRRILLWEITEKTDHLRKLSFEREMLRKDLFKQTDPWFNESLIDLRACYSLLLGGVYYLSLHSKATGGEFCEVDIHTEKGTQRIKKAISDIMELIYTSAKK